VEPVVVVGGSLAGIAAAVRLAKAGHPVQLYEASDRLGGPWAPYAAPDGTRLDDAPGVLGFPAPWRDVFRKSGRTLEAELGRVGAELVPAPPTRYVFADGAELDWPTDRGEQFLSLQRAYGRGAAERWQDLVDGLDATWQAVRRLGLETELTGRDQLTREVRDRLDARRTLARLAGDLDHPHLAALARSTAYRLGSDPARTPAWCAVGLAVERTFGRWRVAADGDRDGRSSVLLTALTERLGVRRVAVRLGSPVTALTLQGGRVRGVATATGAVRAAAVICTVDPWQLVGDLLPGSAGGRLRRGVRRSRPALAPAVGHRVDPVPPPRQGVTETVRLDPDGCPVVEYRRPAPGGTLVSTHDFTRATPRAGAGIAWRGFGSWLRRPAVTTEVPGLYLAGPFSPGGAAPWAVLLSGALASYAVHDRLGEQ
jgi:UDP-galactopyranose mutase